MGLLLLVGDLGRVNRRAWPILEAPAGSDACQGSLRLAVRERTVSLVLAVRALARTSPLRSEWSGGRRAHPVLGAFAL